MPQARRRPCRICRRWFRPEPQVGERFGFRFVAHQRGDANRSARVARPLSFIESNFLAIRNLNMDAMIPLELRRL